MDYKLVIINTYMRLKIPGQRKSDYLKLYLAALKGNWDEANKVVQKYPQAIRDSITEKRESILHTAFASKHIAFVKNLVGCLTDEDLERINVDGNTALCFAAKIGIVSIAKRMVKKNNRLPLIRSREARTPLHIAALFRNKDVVSYLFSVHFLWRYESS